MLERRKYPRFRLIVDARYKSISSEEAYRMGKTKNVSAEGVCFTSDDKFKKGDHVSLEVELFDDNPPVTIVGEIRWVTERKDPERGKKKYFNGVKLIDIHKSDENRFLKYYCDKMVEKLSGYLKI